MAIYFVTLSIIISCIPFEVVLKNKMPRLSIVVSAVPFILMFFLCSFKDINVGYDTINYYNWYNCLLNGIDPGVAYASNEFLFKAIYKLFSILKMPYRIVMILFYGVTFSLLFISFKKLSKNVSFSALIFFTFGFFTLGLSALRQLVAISIVIFALSLLIKNKKYLLFAVLVILAGLIHKSAFVFILCIPLSFLNVKFNLSNILVITILFIIFFIISSSVFQTIYYSLNLTEYIPTFRDGVGGYYFLFLLIFSVLALLNNNDLMTSIFKKIFKEKDEFKIIDNTNNKFLLFYLLGVAFQATSIINYAAPRLGTQFLCIACIFVPNIISQIKYKKWRIIIGILAIICFIGFYLYDSILPNYLGIWPYKFSF